MKLTWSIGFFLLITSAWAQQGQFPSDLWHEGKIVLEQGDTLRGSLKYDMQNDILQFEKGGQLESFSARKVLSFEIFDRMAKRFRHFYSLPYAVSGGYKSPIFFELLSEGRLTLLCRESIEYKNYANTYYSYGSYSRLVLIHKFFFMKDDGNIDSFVGKRNDLVSMMGNKGKDVEKYIRSNRLDLDDKYEFAQIVSYYNSLF